jgi:hypothetical protein
MFHKFMIGNSGENGRIFQFVYDAIIVSNYFFNSNVAEFIPLKHLLLMFVEILSLVIL